MKLTIAGISVSPQQHTRIFRGINKKILYFYVNKNPKTYGKSIGRLSWTKT